MASTTLIKETPEQQELLRLLYPANSAGIHEVRYGITTADFNNGDLSAGLGTPPTTIPLSTDEAKFVRSVFDRLSRYIRIEGILDNNLSSPMQIVSVQSVRDDEGNPLTSGITYSFLRYEISSSGAKTLLPRPDSYVTIEAELNDDFGLSFNEQRTLTHEIGHGLGLDHPGGNPDDPAYTDQDTIMSYNVGGDRPATWFSQLDIDSLKEIWGARDSSDGNDSGTAGRLTPTSYRLDRVTGQVIDNFQSGFDKLVIRSTLPGLKSLAMRSVSGSRKVFNRRGMTAPTPLVYWQDTGELYLNPNGKLKGFGSGGGLLADLGDRTPLVASDLSLG